MAVAVVVAPESAWSRALVWEMNEAVAESDVLVIGRLSQVRTWSTEPTDLGRGIVSVEEVLWAPTGTGEELLVIWENPAGVVCPRVEHDRRQGEKLIWLLRRTAEGFRAENHGSVRPVEEKAAVLERLAAQPVVVRTEAWVPGTPGPMVELLLRNAGAKPINLPLFEYRRHRGLDLARTADFAVATQAGEVWEPVALRGMNKGNYEAEIHLPPGDERRIQIDLGDLFVVEPTADQVDSMRATATLGQYSGTATLRVQYPLEPSSPTTRRRQVLLVLGGLAATSVLVLILVARRRQQHRVR